MRKTLTAVTLSMALAATSFVPGQAVAGDREDLAAVLFGASLLAIVAAAAMNDDDDKDRKARPPVVQYQPAPVVTVQPPQRVEVNRSHTLPGQCSRQFNTHDGQRNFIIKDCLERNGVRVSSLPGRCERSIDMPGRGPSQTGWFQGCLNREGYRFR
ncbi:hypothetical protein [Aliiruegeria sabulilitoris]|uniref:hypothetical protein n=1 Tax=Aliiruegeria sabulilitoris TaxID=1510458 RepID=UPI00082EFA71|nr:hypothetical protein [Aliiruegeria sabulilitoris]NDR58547.1 hypothetical protein [Pseudoruegeria sp. M32A2M]